MIEQSYARYIGSDFLASLMKPTPHPKSQSSRIRPPENKTRWDHQRFENGGGGIEYPLRDVRTPEAGNSAISVLWLARDIPRRPVFRAPSAHE